LRDEGNRAQKLNAQQLLDATLG